MANVSPMNGRSLFIFSNNINRKNRRKCKKIIDLNFFKNHDGAQDSRPHKCPLCPARFKVSGTLVTHLRTHTGEKPFSQGSAKSHAFAAKISSQIFGLISLKKIFKSNIWLDLAQKISSQIIFCRPLPSVATTAAKHSPKNRLLLDTG